MMRNLIRRALAPADLLSAAPSALMAHDLGPSDTPLQALSSGLMLPLSYVEALLPLLVLGLCLAGQRRIPLVWALGGFGAGLLAAPWLGDTATLLALGLGCLAGVVVAAMGLPLPAVMAAACTALLSASVTAALFHGGGAPVLMILGSVVTGAILAAVTWGGAVMLRRLPDRWAGIALRVAASWLAARLLILLAFVMAMPAPPVGG